METLADAHKISDISVIVADEDGIVSFVNDFFEKVFQWKASEIVGMPLTTIIPANMHDAHNMGYARFLSTHTPTILKQKLDLPAVKKDGTEFKAEHQIFSFREDGKWMFAATIASD